MVKADNINLHSLILEGIKKYGKEADLNYIDVSEVTDMISAFKDVDFDGDISEWDVRGVVFFSGMFKGSTFNGDLSMWEPVKLHYNYSMFENSPYTGIFNNECYVKGERRADPEGIAIAKMVHIKKKARKNKP